jgi:hypothetical protein
MDTGLPPYPPSLGFLRTHATVGEPAHRLFQKQLTVPPTEMLVELHAIDGVGGVVGAGGAIGPAVTTGGAVTTGAFVGAAVADALGLRVGLGVAVAVGFGVGLAVGFGVAVLVAVAIIDGEVLGPSVTRMVRGVGPGPLVAAIST